MAADQRSLSEIPLAAPIDTDSAGKGGSVAIHSVFRVICPREGSGGTGFLHKSGRIVTAEHVVHGCTEIFLLSSLGAQVPATVAASDVDTDLALLMPRSPIITSALPIAAKAEFAVGTQVTTWGYPGGYSGSAPLLSVGYLSGLDAIRSQAGSIIRRWVVNAAFNRGNSGGPLVHLETGEVIGVVSSKLAPISPIAISALQALSNQKSGFTYEATRPDGSKTTVSEGQVVGMVLEELRAQVQLVIGYAALAEDLRAFLKRHGVDP